MVICPKCNAKIKNIIIKRSGVGTTEIYLDKKTGLEFKNESFEGDGIYEEYFCPECQDELDLDYDEIEDFLRNEDKLQKVVREKVENIK